MGALVSTAMAHKGADMAYYRKLMGKAVELYAAAVKHKGRYSSKDIYKCAPQVCAAAGNACAPAWQWTHEEPHSSSWVCIPAFLHPGIV